MSTPAVMAPTTMPRWAYWDKPPSPKSTTSDRSSWLRGRRGSHRPSQGRSQRWPSQARATNTRTEAASATRSPPGPSPAGASRSPIHTDTTATRKTSITSSSVPAPTMNRPTRVRRSWNSSRMGTTTASAVGMRVRPTTKARGQPYPSIAITPTPRRKGTVVFSTVSHTMSRPIFRIALKSICR